MIKEINRRNSDSKKLKKAYDRFDYLLTEIEQKDIPIEQLDEFNGKIFIIDNFDKDDKKLINLINKTYEEFIDILRSRLKITKNGYYESTWQVNGLSFGLLIGAITSAYTNKPAFLPIGLPIGMAIGMVIGMVIDKKAENENRQIRIEEY